MLRKSGLFLLAAVLFSGCDFLSTREFRPKPSEIRSLSGLSKAGDSVAYRATESLWDSAAQTRLMTLSVKRLVFTLKGDSLDGSDTLKVLSLRISEDSSGALLETGLRTVRFAPDGILLAADPAGGGGARFFPLKVSSGSRAAAETDGSLQFALPALLVEGWGDQRKLGVLDLRREQTALDTLSYQGHLEEAWGVRETVLDGEAVLSRGMFWYGASGLLKADQAWAGFDWRDGNGSHPGGAELRRALERL
ncbi:MAG TPA: hypothetical protein VJ385_08085 [Fibrobacteria bacterium]|nr:hypothetical protein [Fibrobacteria bacterium]